MFVIFKIAQCEACVTVESEGKLDSVSMHIPSAIANGIYSSPCAHSIK